MTGAKAGRLVVASTGGASFVSTKYRLGALIREGPWPVDVLSARPFPNDDEIAAIVAAGGDDAVLLLQRVLPGGAAMNRLAAAYRHVAFDFDDAIYATPPELGDPAPARLARQAGRVLLRGRPAASSRRRPLIGVLRRVEVCVAGNAILAAFAARHAARVEVIPTTVAPVAAEGERAPELTIVWMGLPDNLRHLELAVPALRAVAAERPTALRIVSSAPWDRPPVPAEFVPWSEAAARAAMLTATVGLAPLSDDPWTRGKCAFRSIQYGAHGLPTIASPVGITGEVVLDGRTGYLARTPEDWTRALRTLAADPEAARRMGTAARRHVEDAYSDAVALARWRAVLAPLMAGRTEAAATPGG